MANARSRRQEPYLKRLYGYAFSLTDDADAAEEMVHDAIIEARSARSEPRDAPDHHAWLLRLMRNDFIDRTRQPARPEHPPPAKMDEEHVWHFGSETRGVNALAVRLAFARLSRHDREIVGAIDMAGLSYAETADLLDLPKRTVVSRISRARAALYKHVMAAMADDKIDFFPARRSPAMDSGK